MDRWWTVRKKGRTKKIAKGKAALKVLKEAGKDGSK